MWRQPEPLVSSRLGRPASQARLRRETNPARLVEKEKHTGIARTPRGAGAGRDNDARDVLHGVEYAYGAHDGAGSGIFEVAPRRCPGYAFREAILVGTTELTRAEVRAVMADLAADFPGDAYNLVSRNCNHFCDAACRRLVRARIPRWVNRLAKIGVVFTCVIPGNGAAVRRKGDPPAGGGKASIRSRSARQGADAAAPPRPKTFFRSLSVGGGGKNVTPRPLSTSPTPPAPPAFTTAT
uniref:PPPDE domain-containing protein n=1 Tax=Oryza meridionalis TaxID=40149 RepID=A0A0E0DXY5_9ORYZ